MRVFVPGDGLRLYLNGVDVGEIGGLHFNVPLGDQRPAALAPAWDQPVTAELTSLEWNDGLIERLTEPLVDLPLHELPPSRFVLWLSTLVRRR